MTKSLNLGDLPVGALAVMGIASIGYCGYKAVSKALKDKEVIGRVAFSSINQQNVFVNQSKKSSVFEPEARTLSREKENTLNTRTPSPQVERKYVPTVLTFPPEKSSPIKPKLYSLCAVSSPLIPTPKKDTESKSVQEVIISEQDLKELKQLQQSGDVVERLKKLGFEALRQKGSHVVLKHLKSGAVTTVPVHPGKDIKPGTLQNIVKQIKNGF
jgi:predicted RNA binding protein YcfA (HicA-like mRNA interferase family)